MRRGRILIYVFLILVIAGAIGFAVYSLYSGLVETPQPAPVEVYITVKSIPLGGEIKEELLSTIKITSGNLATAMYTVGEESLLLGKTAKFPLDQGVVITESMLGSAMPPISGPQWASLIPHGMIAISIPTDRLGLAGYSVNTGAHVNINACFLFVDVDPAFQTILPNRVGALIGTGLADGTELPVLTLSVLPVPGAFQGRLESDPSIPQPFYLFPSEIKQRPRIACQMLLQDVVVLRIGNFPLNPTIDITTVPTPPAGTNPQAPPPVPVAPNIVTLIVSPQDSIALSYLIRTDVKLTLTLRNPSDDLRQPTEPLTLQFLFNQYNIPASEKLSYSLEPHIIRFGNYTGSVFLPPLDGIQITIPIQP